VRIERKVGAGVAILGSALLVMSGAVPALAGGGASARLAHATGVRFASVANATSTTFGGWAFTSTTATSVTAEFKVPALTCTSKLTGVGPIAVMATGKSTAPNFNAAGILLECSGGRPAAAAAVVVDGAATTGTNALFVGDLMKSTIVNSLTKTTVTVQDLTTGHTFKLTKSGKGAKALQELIIDDSLANSAGTQLPVANFGKITFSKGAISGKPLGMVTPRTGVNMETAGKVLQILTGALSGTKKDSFLTTWKHS
jgi:hypothetical protein